MSAACDSAGCRRGRGLNLAFVRVVPQVIGLTEVGLKNGLKLTFVPLMGLDMIVLIALFSLFALFALVVLVG